MPENLNHTLISLIPKKANPNTPKDLMPISLCNVLMRIVMKTIANRLKLVLPSLIISENQYAFIPNRLITDNALVAFESFHFMKQEEKEAKNTS